MTNTTNINGLVRTIKMNGFDNATEEFGQLYSRLVESVENKAFKFLRNEKYNNFLICPYDLVSYATYEWLLKVIKTWDGQGDFKGFYFWYLEDGFRNAVRPYFNQKHRADLKTTSIDKEIKEGVILSDIIADIQEVEFSEPFLELLEEFGKAKGQEAVEIIKCFSAGSKQQITQAICSVLDICVYDARTRKRVSRLKETFKKLYEEKMGK